MQETSDRTSINWLRNIIIGDEGLRELDEYARQNLSSDPGHDYAHALRVALCALEIADGVSDARSIIAAALLHDIVNPPKNSPLRKRASELSAERAMELLPNFGFDKVRVENIAAAIRDHSYSRGAIPDSLLGQILQDADRLEALGAVGIMRCVATGVQMGGELFHSTDPWARDRELDEQKFAVDHFFTKLFKLPNTMQTKKGRDEALRRVGVMQRFLDDLGQELGHRRV
ncbi:MAG: HD domain-containing protein [Myxococcota bacterium]|nr:HD domain-containing protein [Myxococcota bacterium]